MSDRAQTDRRWPGFGAELHVGFEISHVRVILERLSDHIVIYGLIHFVFPLILIIFTVSKRCCGFIKSLYVEAAFLCLLEAVNTLPAVDGGSTEAACNYAYLGIEPYLE